MQPGSAHRPIERKIRLRHDKGASVVPIAFRISHFAFAFAFRICISHFFDRLGGWVVGRVVTEGNVKMHFLQCLLVVVAFAVLPLLR